MHACRSREDDDSNECRTGRRRTRPALAAIALAALALAACGGGVKESERDTSGRFDGRWVGTVEEGVQSSVIRGNWRQSCTSGDWSFYFDVEDGTISLPLRDVPADEAETAYVDADGAFRLVVPRGQHEISSRESGSAGKVTIRWIFDGRLAENARTVTYTSGNSQFGGNGCRWKLEMNRA